MLAKALSCMTETDEFVGETHLAPLYDAHDRSLARCVVCVKKSSGTKLLMLTKKSDSEMEVGTSVVCYS